MPSPRSSVATVQTGRSTDVVGQEQVGAGRLKRPPNRFELVCLDVGAAAEGCLVRVGVRARHRPPADRVDEGA